MKTGSFKKLTSLLLALMMVLGMLPMNALATDASHTHGYTTTVTAPICTEQGYTTYTCDCGDSYVADFVDAASHAYENGICTGCGVAQWDTDGDGALEILAIGNSFSVDALQYAYQIAQNLGIEEIVLGNLYIGGCTLATHAANAAGNLGKYTYYYNDNGTWTSTGSYKISTALESRNWDYVSMQQGSPVSGVESSYNEDLTNLISYVQERSDAKLVWHMTWAYQQNSTHSAFPTYNKDQMTMYNAIVSAVQNKIVTNSNFDLIVPNGTAVQNSRTSSLGDTTTRDGYHMSKDYGRYLTGLLFIKTVTGLSIDGVTYAPSGVDAEEKAIAIESANNAAAKPFAVTKSKYVNEVPEEGYILLKPELYKGAYWHPLNTDSYNELIDDQSNSPNFFATIRFTRETLPVGSIITLESGWQYRPDGWVTDALQTGTREGVTTKAFQIVTEEWWGDYTIRSFNISRTSGGSVMDLTEEEMRSIFQIYVPEANHSHTYQNGVCTLCGAEQPSPVITKQPTDSEAVMGEPFCVTVEADGEGLKYQWYFRNAGSNQWYKSSVKDNTYDDIMTTARAGREVYCVITDANGNSVTTDTVKLLCIPSEELAIITQPTDGEAILGERYCVAVEAKGESLKYQWYFRNAGSETWYKSGVTDNTYDDVMTTARADREVYCVITDAYGNKVTTDTVKLIRIPVKLEIISQPTDASAHLGEMFCSTVEARGEGLKYQWYYRNAGTNTWHKSGVRDNTYDDIMTKARNGREIYCVITDMWGNSVTTDIVKLTAVLKTPLKLLGQSYVSAVMGERYCVTVEAQGEDLTYRWYFRNAGSTKWYKSSVTDNTYDDVMTKARANREVYCVITDAFGNQVTTDTATITLAPTAPLLFATKPTIQQSAPEVTPTPVVTPEPTPEVTPTPVVMPEPTPEATPAPVETPEPTPEMTPTPEATPEVTPAPQPDPQLVTESESVEEKEIVDITDKLNALMEKNAKELKKIKAKRGYIYAALYYYVKVTDGGDWDIKRTDEWKFEEGKTYVYQGVEMRMDDPGNIHFGYLGAILFPEEFVCFGAGMNNFLKFGFSSGDIYSYFDDPQDQEMMRWGYAMYEAQN